MNKAAFKVWRTDDSGGGYFADYNVDVVPGMVVLDAIHQIQAAEAPDLAVRWNCKAGKCGSCSAEINGNPKLMCMTRLNTLNLLEPMDLKGMGYNSARYIHTVYQAMNLAFADRDFY